MSDKSGACFDLFHRDLFVKRGRLTAGSPYGHGRPAPPATLVSLSFATDPSPGGVAFFMTRHAQLYVTTIIYIPTLYLSSEFSRVLQCPAA